MAQQENPLFPGTIGNVKNEKNLGILKIFITRLKFPMTLENGDIVIRANIVYYSRKQLYQDVLNVKLINHGYDKGDVHLLCDGQVITMNEFDTVLKNDFSQFSFSSNGTVLTIENRSTKMGEYRVDIKEKIQKQ